MRLEHRRALGPIGRIAKPRQRSWAGAGARKSFVGLGTLARNANEIPRAGGGMAKVAVHAVAQSTADPYDICQKLP